MHDLTKFWFLEDFDLVKKMGRKNLMKMCSMLEMIDVKKGEELNFSREDKNVVYFLKNGLVKVVSSVNDHTIHVIKEGNIYGELAMCAEGFEGEKAIALEDGVVCFIEVEDMQLMIENHPLLRNNLLKLNGLKIARLQRRLVDLLHKDSKTRITEYILDYIKEFGTANGDKIEAKNLLSHNDIASLTNTSRQTVSNVLSGLRKDGIIDYNSKKIEMIGLQTSEIHSNGIDQNNKAK